MKLALLILVLFNGLKCTFSCRILLMLLNMVHKRKRNYLKKENEDESKNPNLSKISKKAKIIIRNLPFKNLSEKRLEDLFKKYGDIEEVKLLRKDDGKFVGCGFIQFKHVTSAAKAIRHANEKEISGRKIIVDWALPKKTFLEKIKKLEDYQANINSKQSWDVEDSNIQDYEIDNKPDIWGSDDEASEDDLKDDTDSKEGEDSTSVDDEDDIADKGSDIDEINKKKGNKLKNNQSFQKKQSNKISDTEDGKTVFVRNIPFSVTNEDLGALMERYGPIIYALICIDKLTEHSKGTGFVKFKETESATKCIKDSMKISLHDSPLNITMAVSKEKLENKKNSKAIKKDSRNLYLLREGVIIAGSKAAAGVSAGDMAKRLQLEQWKNQILKNLNMFVSKTRLIVHNLPSSYDDFKLKELFLKHSNPKAVIKEAKVMYDKKKIDASGKGMSKEIGFVSFSRHEDALVALRNINNNPNIFTLKRRPIVAFSIENKAVINSKIKRVEKSRAKLGITITESDKLSKLNRKQRRFIRRRQKFIERRKEQKRKKEGQFSQEANLEEDESNTNKKRKNPEGSHPRKKIKLSSSVSQVGDSEAPKFVGVVSEPGKKIKLRSKFRLKNQATIHRESLKKDRRKRREIQRKKISVRKPFREKKGKTKLIDDINLSKFIKKHRESIQNSSTFKKWYDNA